MKKVNLVFRVLLILVAVAAVLHTGIAYIIALTTWKSTSFPAEVVFFFVGIWYVLGVIFLLLIWLIVWRIQKRKAERKQAQVS